MQTTSSSSSSGSGNKPKISDAMIAKFTGGLCFDFYTKDSNMYVVLSHIPSQLTYEP